MRDFNFDGEGGTIFNEVVQLAVPEDFAIVEVIKDNGPNGGLIRKRHRDPLEPPFHIKLIERDDGGACPAPEKTRALLPNAWFADLMTFSLTGDPSDLNWENFDWLWGGGNDKLGEFTITSFNTLEAWSMSFYDGPKADIWFRNRGFNRNQIPPAQDPYNP